MTFSLLDNMSLIDIFVVGNVYVLERETVDVSLQYWKHFFHSGSKTWDATFNFIMLI